MASHTQALADIESNRTINNLFCIHLYQEGAWFRAYNYSAYLLNLLINTNRMTSTPVKRQEKKMNEPIVFIALNWHMFPKIFPQLSEECFIDKHCIFDAREYLKNHDYITTDTYMGLYQEWLDGLMFYSSKPNSNNKQIHKNVVEDVKHNVSDEDKVKNLIKDIVYYRLDKNTPLAWGEFISTMQRQAIDIMDCI